MLSENELLEALAREIGVLMINCRSSELREEKLTLKLRELETYITEKESERSILLERLKKAEDVQKDLREQINGKNKTNR